MHTPAMTSRRALLQATPRVAALRPLLGMFCAAGLALSPLLGHAAISDPAGDFYHNFGGSKSSADLDVLAASAVFDPSNDTFTLTATLAGVPGTTAGALYVWGVNTGAGAARFAGADSTLSGVLFNKVVLVNTTGAGGALLGTVSGDTITAVVSGTSLGPSTGFAESAYTWNLWPRDINVVPTATDPLAPIADFAPDNTNFATTLAVPEPQTYALMLAGLGAVGWVAKRRKA